MSGDPTWPDCLEPLPPGTVITTREAIRRRVQDWEGTYELVRTLIRSGALHRDEHGAWLINGPWRLGSLTDDQRAMLERIELEARAEIDQEPNP